MGSSNAVATMLGLERALKQELAPEDRLRLAGEVGSDLPLFLVGGTVLGLGRGEQVFPLQDLPPLDLVIVTPALGVSTPQAFKDWDEQFGTDTAGESKGKLTSDDSSDRIKRFGQAVFTWLMGSSRLQATAASGVPVETGGNRAETPLLDLVRAGIENDFERVVFSKYPELREVKRVLEREGARYASLSGSGSTLYGLFESSPEAEQAADRMRAAGMAAQATRSLPRTEYWRQVFENV